MREPGSPALASRGVRSGRSAIVTNERRPQRGTLFYSGHLPAIWSEGGGQDVFSTVASNNSSFAAPAHATRDDSVTLKRCQHCADDTDFVSTAAHADAGRRCPKPSTRPPID